MDSRKIVYHETAIIAVGCILCAAAMIGVFAALGEFQMNVLWGALAGTFVTIANYFLMAVTVSVAADRAEKGNVKQAKNLIKISSLFRLIFMGLTLVLGIKLGANVIALVLPLLFVRPVLLLAEFFRKKGD